MHFVRVTAVLPGVERYHIVVSSLVREYGMTNLMILVHSYKRTVKCVHRRRTALSYYHGLSEYGVYVIYMCCIYKRSQSFLSCTACRSNERQKILDEITVISCAADISRESRKRRLVGLPGHRPPTTHQTPRHRLLLLLFLGCAALSTLRVDAGCRGRKY